MSSWKHIPSTAFLRYGFIAIVAMRLVMVFTMGMMPQDAYYYYYSEHLSLSYFDHPPGVALQLWLFTTLFGHHVWALKLSDFLVTCVTLFALYRFAGEFLPARRREIALYILGSTLMFTNVSIVTTPDVLLLLMWTLALHATYRALQSPQLWRWVIAGLIAGLTFDCKYTGLYIPVAFAGYLLMSKQHRRYLFSLRYAAYLAMFALAILPVVIWNVDNAFASFQFQSGDRVSSIMEFNIRPQYFFGTVGLQMLVLLPVLFTALVVVSWKYLYQVWRRRRMPHSDNLFLLCFSVPLIAGFLAISWIYWVKINWMLPAYITGGILAMRFLGPKAARWQMGIAFVFTLLLTLQILFYFVPVQSDDTYWGWDQLAEQVSSLHEEYPESFFFAKDGYKTTAVLNFYVDTKVYAANIVGEPALEYSIRDHDLSGLEGRDALFLDSRNMPSHFNETYEIPEELNGYFDHIGFLKMITLSDGRGRPLRQFAVVQCTAYHPPPDPLKK